MAIEAKRLLQCNTKHEVFCLQHLNRLAVATATAECAHDLSQSVVRIPKFVPFMCARLRQCGKQRKHWKYWPDRWFSREYIDWVKSLEEVKSLKLNVHSLCNSLYLVAHGLKDKRSETENRHCELLQQTIARQVIRGLPMWSRDWMIYIFVIWTVFAWNQPGFSLFVSHKEGKHVSYMDTIECSRMNWHTKKWPCYDCYLSDQTRHVFVPVLSLRTNTIKMVAHPTNSLSHSLQTQAWSFDWIKHHMDTYMRDTKHAFEQILEHTQLPNVLAEVCFAYMVDPCIKTTNETRIEVNE